MEHKEQEEFKHQEQSIMSRILKGVVALFVIIGFLYISGINQFFFYQRTSPTTQQSTIESAIYAKQISIPLSILILQSEGVRGSFRSKENAQHLVYNAGEIWNQANINLTIKNISIISLDDEEITSFIRFPREFIIESEYFDSSVINVFLVQHLNGINGFAFGGLQSVAIADYTTVYDFRTLAHEIGHILTLRHVTNDERRLMSSGVNGINLSLQEIIRARENAELY